MAELVSYAIGCMMGRYSLDSPGLIYAHSGNVGFDATRYTTFSADSDGIVPLHGLRVVRRRCLPSPHRIHLSGLGCSPP